MSTERKSTLVDYLNPFSLALLLTLICFLIAFFFSPNSSPGINYGFELLNYWYLGIWDLLRFGMQMMLILVLGHILALTPLVNSLIGKLTERANTNMKAILIVSLSSILLAYFNWGLALVFSAVLVRKMGERAVQEKRAINYPLLAAAAYSCMMVWHGGFSGSAPLSIAEPNHMMVKLSGVIPVYDTLLSQMNIVAFISILVLIPSLLLFMNSRKGKLSMPKLKLPKSEESKIEIETLPFIIGILIIISAFGVMYRIEGSVLKAINLNYVNFVLLGLGFVLMPNLKAYTKALNEAISGASGILIQFPFYAGIMGLLSDSGVMQAFSAFLISNATEVSFPIYTFISAGIVNFFVPSGGGQWAIQGPIIIEGAKELGVNLPKAVMALAYGDQLTNMVQPFWALPLLGITKVKAADILPYTLLLMLLGIIIFGGVLLIF